MSTSATLSVSRPLWRDYLELCKPKVVALMLITSVVGMILASREWVGWQVLILGNLGIGLAASSAAVINHVVDMKIDALMGRTHKRPIPRGKISPEQAIMFSMVLCALSMTILIQWVNVLTAMLSLITLLGYAVFYTLFLKRATPQNIVIGGATGAAPPLLGWCAVTGDISPYALLLVLIIFVWTPPHFWALAIHRKEEYKKANIPMLPVTHGVEFTKLCITLYTFLLIAVTLLPFAVGMSGVFYLISSLLLGGIFMYYALTLQYKQESLTAINTFKYSCLYLLLLFAALLADHFLALTGGTNV